MAESTSKPKQGFSWSEAALETQLRAAAPSLPPALRARTLARYAAERAAQRRQRRTQQRWMWSLGGICVFQWLALSYLDGQNAALLAGPHANRYSLVAQVPSPAELRAALTLHSNLLAALGRNSQVFERAIGMG